MKERRAGLWLPSGAALLRREAAGRTLAAIGPPKWGFPFVLVGVSETGMKAALHRTMEQTCARADCTVVLTHENRDNTLPVEI